MWLLPQLDCENTSHISGSQFSFLFRKTKWEDYKNIVQWPFPLPEGISNGPCHCFFSLRVGADIAVLREREVDYDSDIPRKIAEVLIRKVPDDQQVSESPEEVVNLWEKSVLNFDVFACGYFHNIVDCNVEIWFGDSSVNVGVRAD